jgi:hypothetical protein
MYVDLNPALAGLAQHPEEWEGGFYFISSIKQSGRCLKRVSCLSRGYVVGKRETVEAWLDELKSWGRLLCRKHMFETDNILGICSIRS